MVKMSRKSTNRSENRTQQDQHTAQNHGNHVTLARSNQVLMLHVSRLPSSNHRIRIVVFVICTNNWTNHDSRKFLRSDGQMTANI